MKSHLGHSIYAIFQQTQTNYSSLQVHNINELGKSSETVFFFALA